MKYVYNTRIRSENSARCTCTERPDCCIRPNRVNLKNINKRNIYIFVFEKGTNKEVNFINKQISFTLCYRKKREKKENKFFL